LKPGSASDNFIIWCYVLMKRKYYCVTLFSLIINYYSFIVENKNYYLIYILLGYYSNNNDSILHLILYKYISLNKFYYIKDLRIVETEVIDLSKPEPIPSKLTASTLNEYIYNTADFINKLNKF